MSMIITVTELIKVMMTIMIIMISTTAIPMALVHG